MTHHEPNVPETPRPSVVVVAGGGEQRHTLVPIPARELFVGETVALRLEYAERLALELDVDLYLMCPIRGLIGLEQLVTTTDATFAGMSRHQRGATVRMLSHQIRHKVAARAGAFDLVELHAGSVYAEILGGALELAGVEPRIVRPVVAMTDADRRDFYGLALSSVGQ